ncbi:MAG: hypothetical protein FWC36_00040 [Spirochaetes bacterium]|nr:hypothetical protein [Spirochaetota bacterium]
MTKTTTLRQEIHSMVDAIPERNLSALRPLLTVLLDEPIYIETDLTDEEHALIERGCKQYREHPEDFVPLESLLK